METPQLEEAQEKLRIKLLGELDDNNVRPLVQEYIVGESGYLFAINEQGTSTMNPHLEGRETPEEYSKAVEEMLNKGATGGFLTYESLNLLTNKTEERLVYVKTSLIGG